MRARVKLTLMGGRFLGHPTGDRFIKKRYGVRYGKITYAVFLHAISTFLHRLIAFLLRISTLAVNGYEKTNA